MRELGADEPHCRTRRIRRTKKVIAPDVTGFWGRDRADLVDATSHEVWEIKPDNPFSGAFDKADLQLMRYLGILGSLGPFDLGSVMSFPMPRVYPLVNDPERRWALYRYYDASGGLIVYDILSPEEGRRLQAAPSSVPAYASDDNATLRAVLKATSATAAASGAISMAMNFELDFGTAALTASMGVDF